MEEAFCYVSATPSVDLKKGKSGYCLFSMCCWAASAGTVRFTEVVATAAGIGFILKIADTAGDEARYFVAVIRPDVASAIVCIV